LVAIKKGEVNIMAKGQVKWFDLMKGFGFIDQDGGEEVFVHQLALNPSTQIKGLQEGDMVEFEAIPGRKSKQAINVVKLN
jgi:CspA family cold shock protein